MTMVLVVEDEPRIRDVLVDTLLDAGFDVVEAADGTDAIQMMAEHVPDIMLLDVMMPGLDGFQVMEKMKENPETESIPVVLLTAMPADQGEIAAQKMGASHYISKPWEPGVVEATIRITLQETQVLLNSQNGQGTEQLADVIYLKSDNVNQVAMEGQLARFQSGRNKDKSANSDDDDIPSIKTAEKLPALEQKMGGGLPLSTITLAVGAASSGKSTLCQHFLYGALEGGYGAVYYTSEQTQDSLLTQMKTIGMDVSRYHQKEKLRVYAVPEQSESEKAEDLLGQLGHSMERLSRGAHFIIVDSITDLAGSCPEQAVIAFFSTCRRLGNQGKTMFVAVHSYAFGSEMFTRLRTLCDGYVTLGSEEVRGKSVRTLEVNKINTTEKTRDNMVSFVVEPEIGMRLIPMNKTKA